MISKVPYIRQSRGGGLYDFAKKKYVKTHIPNSVIKNGYRIRTSGCGQCSTAMALYYCLGKYFEPNKLRDKYNPGHGSSHNIGVYEASKRGVYTIHTDNYDLAKKWISCGAIALNIQGKGNFTRAGHFILWIGVVRDKVAVNDPASPRRSYRMSGKVWTKGQFHPTTKKYGYGYTIFFPHPLKTVKIGDKGEDVVRWQLFLKWKGYDITCDGAFGAKTEKATVQYQKASKLASDGIAGPKTRKNAIKEYQNAIK